MPPIESVAYAVRRSFPPKQTLLVLGSGIAGLTAALRLSPSGLTRRLDDDPYTDCFWGIVTGYDAASALRIAQLAAPLTIHKAAAGTSIPLELCQEGVWYSEVKKNQCVRRRAGEGPVEERGPDDTTKSFVDLLNNYTPDLFVTSGHATEREQVSRSKKLDAVTTGEALSR